MQRRSSRDSTHSSQCARRAWNRYARSIMLVCCQHSSRSTSWYSALDEAQTSGDNIHISQPGGKRRNRKRMAGHDTRLESEVRPNHTSGACALANALAGAEHDPIPPTSLRSTHRKSHSTSAAGVRVRAHLPTQTGNCETFGIVAEDDSPAPNLVSRIYGVGCRV